MKPLEYLKCHLQMEASKTLVWSLQQFNSIRKPIMTQFGSSDTQVIISYPYITNSNFIIWSTNTSSVVASYNVTASGSSISAVAGSQNNGMLYIASIGDVNVIDILKFYYYDPNVTSSIITGSIDFNQQSSLSLTESSASLSASSFPDVTNFEVLIFDVSVDQQANSTTDIIYTNGRDQFHPVASSYSGNLSFDYFCSKSGETFTTSIYDINSSGASSWLSIDSSYTFLTVDAPTVTTTTNYSYGISYLSGDVNITSENIIGIYVCGISNCASCEYTTRDTACTTCDTGYTLSSGGSNCEEGLIEDDRGCPNTNTSPDWRGKMPSTA